MDAQLSKFFVFVWFCVGASGKITWDKSWINNNLPYENGTEIEPPPNATYLSSVCPPGSGGKLTLQCQDSKGEPFKVFQNNSVLHFVATCSPVIGILCNPYVGSNESCPDLQMNFGCDIPEPTTTTDASKVPGKSTTSPKETSSTKTLVDTSPTKNAPIVSSTKSPKGTPPMETHKKTSPTKGPQGTGPITSLKGTSQSRIPGETSTPANNIVPGQTTPANKQRQGLEDGNGGINTDFSRPVLAFTLVISIWCFQNI